MQGIFLKKSMGLLAVAALFLFGVARSESTDSFSPKVRSLLAAMSLDEKLALTQGGHDPAYLGQAGYLAGVQRLGIPSLRMADGPVGILNRFDTTALPQAISLAATFDPELAKEYGEVLGQEARATGMDVVLGPMVNIARVPNWGRNITSFGEDPLLAGRLVSGEIAGIQAQGAMATTKHFVANNQSDHAGGGLNNEPGYDFIVDERTLHEIYLPAFEASVRAGTASMMAAYNHINGKWNAENPDTLTGILRKEMHWDGFVMSDWHANHTNRSLAAGLDLEMPGLGPVQPVGAEAPYFGSGIKSALADKTVVQADIDTACGRILTQMEKLGMLDGHRVPAPDGIDVAKDAAVARKVAALGAVLLKNDGVLPLTGTGKVALIGPTARQIAVGPGGGRSEGFPDRLVSPLDALKKSGASPTFALGDDLQGVTIPAAAFSGSNGEPGLERSSMDGAPSIREANVDHTGAKALPVGRAYRWKGVLKVEESGTYLLSTQSWGGATYLSVDGAVKASAARLFFGNGVPHRLSSLLPTTDDLDNGQVFIRLEKDRAYQIELLAQAESYSTMQVRLAWVTPAMQRQNREEAVRAAKEAGTAVVFVWARGGEGFDASQNLSLPYDQDALIEAVVAANPNTLVVLNTGNPVSMPWKDKVRGILEMWFPGQEGGWATADILLGKVNPSGRLPITFPARATDTPALDPKHPERIGADGKAVVYSEGIFVGYRYYEAENRVPLYPFGYGLSYTTFAYSDLKVAPKKYGATVSFSVKNSGRIAGIATPQVYVGAPDQEPVPMAKKALCGFARLSLAPGESKQVSIELDKKQMGYWSVKRHGWMTPAGERTVFLGSDAAAPALKQAFRFESKDRE